MRGINETVDANYVFSLMQPELSPAGSSRREVEEKLMDDFQDLLMSIDEGNTIGCTSALAWKFDDDQSDGIPDADTLPCNERFEEADISCAGVLGWIIGQKHRTMDRWLQSPLSLITIVKFATRHTQFVFRW